MEIESAFFEEQELFNCPKASKEKLILDPNLKEIFKLFRRIKFLQDGMIKEEDYEHLGTFYDIKMSLVKSVGMYAKDRKIDFFLNAILLADDIKTYRWEELIKFCKETLS